MNHQINQAIKQAIKQSIKSSNHSINQDINQSTNQPINQSTNQSINQSTYRHPPTCRKRDSMNPLVAMEKSVDERTSANNKYTQQALESTILLRDFDTDPASPQQLLQNAMIGVVKGFRCYQQHGKSGKTFPGMLTITCLFLVCVRV